MPDPAATADAAQLINTQNDNEDLVELIWDGGQTTVADLDPGDGFDAVVLSCFDATGPSQATPVMRS